MEIVNANLDPFQALSNEESAFLRAVDVLKNSMDRKIYTLTANELVALLGGENNPKRRLEILCNMLQKANMLNWKLR